MPPPVPDLAALYRQHREAMHHVAAAVLREAGLADQANDAVQDAIESIISSPPSEVQNWEAFLVTAAKRKGLDRLRSATVRHAGPRLTEEHDRPDDVDVADDAANAVDRSRRASHVWDALAVLDERHRKAVWLRVACERPRDEVAAALDVTPGRISQMVKRGLEQLHEAISREEGN
jgi:RNA polymerase sigma factor (sigma-70 family)